jgi:hypothetical protein
LPGGHPTTHEQPEALAALIVEFEEGLQWAEGDRECS